MVTPAPDMPVIEPASEGRRERKKRELHQRIYETARQLFLEHGFEATTVEQIAEAADIAQATFFNHFHNKGAVLREMTSEVTQGIQTLVDEQLSQSGTAQERIAGFAEHVSTSIRQAQGLARDILLELISSGSDSGEAIPYLTRVQGPFSDILREGQERGDVRTDLDVGFLAEMVLGTLNMALIGWLNNPAYPLEERLSQTTAFIGEAIGPQQ